MTPEDINQLGQGISLANTGQRSQAYQQIVQVAERNPSEISPLLWAAFTAEGLGQSERFIAHAVGIAPFDPTVKQAQDWLANEKAKQAPPPSPSFPPFAPEYPYASPAQAQYQPVMPVQYVPVGPYQYQPVMPVQYVPVFRQPIPGRILSEWAVFGWFCLYFIATLFAIAASTFFTFGLGTIVLLIGSSIWAAVDSNQRRARFGPQAATHPTLVVVFFFFLWFVMFPVYLAKRHAALAYYGA